MWTFVASAEPAPLSFGDRAKDPRTTQAQLRHADPTITLKHYQKSIPESVRAAGDELERDLAFGVPSAPSECPLNSPGYPLNPSGIR